MKTLFLVMLPHYESFVPSSGHHSSNILKTFKDQAGHKEADKCL